MIINNAEEAREVIEKALVDVCCFDTYQYQGTKLGDMGMDSLDHVEVIMFIEEQTSHEISDDLAEMCRDKTTHEAAELLYAQVFSK